MSPGSDLHDSLGALMKLLAAFSKFPKYSLERRIDIFLVPFVEALVKAKLSSNATLVAPEFPILRDIRTDASDAGTGAVESALKELSRRTVNVDYLFHLPGPKWLFVELKTDVRSFDTKQAELYADARRRGMRRLRADLDFVSEGTRQPEKYAHLLDTLREFGGDGLIKVAYLAPRKLLQHKAYQRHQEKPERAIDHFFALEDLGLHAARAEPPFPPLWPVVQELLERVLAPTEEVGRRDSGGTHP